MKLLVFSDLHCDTRAAARLVDLAQEVDVVIGAGDFATVRRNLQPTIDVLSQIRQPAVLVPGNSETDDELRAACADWPSAHVLHGEHVAIQGVTFYGLGAAVPTTPFGSWSFDLSEAAARQLLAACPAAAVMVTHSPPKGLVDRSSAGASLGSLAVLESIQRIQPPLVVCGHIHESAGQRAQYGDAVIINAGPCGIIYQLDR